MEAVHKTDQIQEILWGKSFVDVLDGFGEERSFILRSLSEREQNLANYIYRKEYKKSVSLGLLTMDQLKVSYCAYGVWTGAHEDEIHQIRMKIDKTKQQIRNAEFTPVRMKQLKKNLKKQEDELKTKESHKLNIFSLSAENRAEEVKRRYIVSLATETLEEEPYWPTQESFMQERDSDLIVNLAIIYLRKNYLPEKDIRSLARSGEWRYRWSASKNGESLFGKPVSQWSDVQNLIVFWSQYYDSIYEAYDRPSDAIIEDDDACDAWVKNQNKKAAQERSAQDKKKSKSRASSHKDHQEHFIMARDPEAVQKIQDMNPDTVRARFRREQEQISKVKNGGKRIKEWNLGERRFNTPTNITRKGK